MSKENNLENKDLTATFGNTMLGDSRNYKSKIEYPIGGFAPGMYMSKCTTCKDEFLGDKRAVQCEPCAINTVNKSNNNALYELHNLKTAIRTVFKNIDELRNIAEV